MKAVLLLAHGSTRPEWKAPVEAIAERLEAQGRIVACAYLDHIAPTIESAADALIEAGADRISVVPLFFGVGRHVAEHIPERLEGLRAAHPEVVFEAAPSIGELDPVLDAIALALEHV